KLRPTSHNEMCRNQDGKPVIEGPGGKFPGLVDIRQENDPGDQCGFEGEAGAGINCWVSSDWLSCLRGCSYSNHVCDTVPGGIRCYGGYIYYYQQEKARGRRILGQ